MVVIGAMPGSTPTSVPISAPRKQKPMLAGVSATAKPVARLANRSMRPIAAKPGSAGRARSTNSSTAKIASATRQHRVLAQPHVVGGKAGADHDDEAGEREAGKRQQDREQRDRRRDQEQRPPRDLGKRDAAGERGAHAQHDAVDHDDQRQAARHIARAHRRRGADRQLARQRERQRAERDQKRGEGKIGNVEREVISLRLILRSAEGSVSKDRGRRSGALP